MRQPIANANPSIASELGSLAGLYRTVFWMIGRKASYGRVLPPEAEAACLKRDSRASAQFEPQRESEPEVIALPDTGTRIREAIQQ